jgi:type I restriction enzyme M protein
MALTYEEIRNLNWFIADQVRDKGNGNNNDAMSVAIPILIFKRLLDMRREYKGQFNSPVHKEQYNIMQLYGDIDQAIANYQNNASVFAVKADKLDLYRIEWSDILAFPDQHDTETALDYADELGGQFKSTSTDKVQFIEEIIASFQNEKISEIFNYLDFKTKINSSNITQILTYQEFGKLLKEMDKYDLSLSNAPSDVFSEAYMDLLKRFAPQKGSKQGEFFTPNKIAKALIGAVNPTFLEEGVTVIGDPTSGACTFMTECAEHMIEQERIKLKKEVLTPTEKKAILEKLQIVVQEKDRVSFAAGEANLLLHDLLDKTDAYHGNTITEFSEKIASKWLNKINYIFANPPYGLDDYGFKLATDNKKEGKELERWGYGVPNASDGEYAFLQSILALVTNASEKAIAGVVMPLGTLFRDSTLNQRKIFLEQNDWVEGIILLPGKLFNTTDIPVCFWIINKNKSENNKGKVFFINAENDFVKMKNKNDLVLEKLIETYLNKKEEEGYSKYVKIVAIDETDNDVTIKNNNFDLSVNKYVKKSKTKEIIDINKVLSETDTIKQELLLEQEKMANVLNQIKLLYSN